MASMGQHRKNPNRSKVDFYPTEPAFVEALLRQEQFEGIISEPSCGEGHVSNVLIDHGYEVISSDLVDYGYGSSIKDFLQTENKVDNIVTNPPYGSGMRFVHHALELANKKVAFLMKLNFAEGQGRHSFFVDNPPSKIILLSDRMRDSQFPHAWMIWDNENPTKTGETKFIWETAKWKPKNEND